MTVYEREVKNFRELNQVAKQHGVVLFGSTFAKGIPVCELRQAFDLDCDIYNRSFSDLSVFDAKNVLADCVNALHPSKILLQLAKPISNADIGRFRKLSALMKRSSVNCKSKTKIRTSCSSPSVKIKTASIRQN